MVIENPFKNMNKNQDKTSGLYKIAAKVLKKVKTGSSYKTQLYQAQYPNKLLLNAVLMNVFKWEKVIDVLVEKSNILEKENNMDRELVYVIITEMMWSKFGLKGTAKNLLAVKKYKAEFLQLMKDNDLEKLTTSTHAKVLIPRFFRVNTLLTTIEKIIEKLSNLKFIKLKTPKSYAEFLELIKSDKFKEKNVFVQDIHIKELFVFNSKVKFYEIEEYNNGSLIVQDKASCLAAYLLNPEPNSTVLDMCAAPGMKTSHLAAIMQNTGKLYAVDRNKERFHIMQNMLQTYGVQNVETFNMDALTFPYYDDVKYILLDPSCSGSGIVNRVRNDSLGQNQNFQTRLKKLANVHAQLLNHALKSYPNLERLVYSTCSANHEENEAVVDEALSINGKFKLLDCTKMVKGWTNKGAPGYDCSEMCLNAVPSVDCTNGFFISVFVRRDLEDNEAAKEEKNIDGSENVKEEKVFEDIEVDEEEEVVGDTEADEEEKVIEHTKIVDKKVKKVKKQSISNIDTNVKNKSQIKKNKKQKYNEVEKVFEDNEIVDKKVKKVKKSSITNMDKNLENEEEEVVGDTEADEEEKVIEHSKIVDKKVKKVKKQSISNTDTNVKNKSQIKKNKKQKYNEVEKVFEDNEIVDKKVKKVKKSSITNMDKNLEKKSQIIKNKNIESTPLVKSKNAKRRERRLKLEKANEYSGLQTTKAKKQKKIKVEQT